MDWKAATEILALIVGPIAAVQAQRKVDEHKQERERRLALFRTLMATRISRAADPRHTEALNLVEIEFYRDKRVVDAWREYMNHLSLEPTIEGWNLTWTNLFVDLLYEMAQALRFKQIDKTRIRQAYAPRLYAELDRDQTAIRKGLVRVLEGTGAITIQPVVQHPPETKPEPAAFQPNTPARRAGED